MEPDIDVVAETLQQLLADFLTFLPNLIASLMIFFGSLFLAGFLSRGLKKAMFTRRADVEVTQVVETVSRWAIIVLGTTTALSQIGFDLTAFLAGVGIVGFTVGFALQDVSKNFIAGLLLLLQQPFELGHTIEVSGFTGTVLKIDLRATEMRALDGRLVQIPNGDVFTNPIVNFSRADKRRIELQLGVAYGTDLEEARQQGVAALRTIPGVLDDPPPRAVYQTFGNTGIQMTFYFWVDTTKADLLDAQDAGMVGLNAAFETAGIQLPLPTQFVYSRDTKP